MIRKIDWKVYSDNNLVIDNNNVNCILIAPQKIKYKDEYGKHIIDIKNKIYLKESKDNKMTINFIEQTCEFTFDEKEKCIFNIESNLYIKENFI